MVGDECCLDSNDNKMCDEDEGNSFLCDRPYIKVGKDCCLDANSNFICDRDEIIKDPAEEPDDKIPEEEDDDDAPVQKTMLFIENNLVRAGMKIELIEVEEAHGLLKLKLKADGRDFESYVTLDETLLFPNSVEMDKREADILTAQEAADIAVDYINSNLMQPGMTAEFVSVEELDYVFKLQLQMQGSEFESYISKDGEMLFPNAVDMTGEVKKPEEPPAVVKSDKPKAELFIMSYCPYAAQAVKGIIPVMKLLEDSADIKIRYVHIIMHGQKEEDENDRQICIREEQPDNYNAYIKCFFASGKPEECTEEIDNDKLDTCLSEDIEGYKEEDHTLSEDYGVRGSPTLIVNGAQASSERSPAAYLSTICSAFNEAPAECDNELSSETPNPGFG